MIATTTTTTTTRPTKGNTMATFYIAIIDRSTRDKAAQRGTLLSLRGYQHLTAVTDALAWQVKGGFEIGDYRTVTADPALPGVMVCAVTGKPIMVERGCFTAAAWVEFLTETWGPLT